MNAGLRLWQVQKAQGTGLCVGLDPHLMPPGGSDPRFYRQFVTWKYGQEARLAFRDLLRGLHNNPYFFRGDFNLDLASEMLAGLTAYLLRVVELSWTLGGIRLFKPQMAFYEAFGPFGGLVLEAILKRLERLAAESGESAIVILFRISDAKRGDIDSTQLPYYRAILTDPANELFPGMNGRFGFDVMTVTTWMGLDVLTPGLPLFRQGHGAIVVTRTSNPSGTTLQDAIVSPNPVLELSPKQEPFRYTPEMEAEIMEILGRKPAAYELMLYLTEKFSRDNDLNDGGVSPLFSVMGSTTKECGSFRLLRPNGIGLLPGFGHQSKGGKDPFANVAPMFIKEGSLVGFLGILASSRENCFAWQEKYGGSGNPENLDSDLPRSIERFRAQERAAYEAAGMDYPF